MTDNKKQPDNQPKDELEENFKRIVGQQVAANNTSKWILIIIIIILIILIAGGAWWYYKGMPCSLKKAGNKTENEGTTAPESSPNKTSNSSKIVISDEN